MPDEEKKFYVREKEIITKTISFVKNEGNEKVIPVLAGEEGEAIKVGEIVYTLKVPNWELRNYIRSISTSTNMVGISGIDPYIMNEKIIEYLLKSWSVDVELEFDKDTSDRKKVKDIKKLIDSELCDYIFDAIVLIYNRFIS